MATTKQRADKQKEKEKKEKIILAVLVLILIVVGAVMLPSVLKKGDTGAAAQTTGTSLAQTDSSSPSTSGTPNAGGVAASGPAGAATFPEMSTTYKAAEGQLSGFGRFVAGKNPFANLPAQTGTGGTSSTSTTPSGSQFAAATISINGTRETVALHGGFPAESQVFRLDAITASSITVSVAGGSFSGGRSSVTIRKGHTVVLENTVDGTRYALKMISADTSGGTSGGSFSTSTTPGETTSSTSSTGGTTATTGP